MIGEKGTGKTAYAVYLAKNDYKNTVAQLNYIRETDYRKFVKLKKEKHLELSDYNAIWKVIILLLIAKSIKPHELDHFIFGKTKKMKSIMSAIDEYYTHAFSPEITYALNFVDESKLAAELLSKYLKVGGEEKTSVTFNEARFQTNLMYIERNFKEALSDLRLKRNQFLFIDGIDIRPDLIKYEDYLECVKGLANAVWTLNNDFFADIKDSQGRFKVVLLVRPDIFDSIGLQNQTNKIRDNAVFLDWRTTYPEYRHSKLFLLCDKLLSHQQGTDLNVGDA